MLYIAGLIDSLEPGQEAYFYLTSVEENSETKVTIHASFTGSKTGKKVLKESVFPFTNPDTR
jgi:hypothetical protein